MVEEEQEEEEEEEEEEARGRRWRERMRMMKSRKIGEKRSGSIKQASCIYMYVKHAKTKVFF